MKFSPFIRLKRNNWRILSFFGIKCDIKLQWKLNMVPTIIQVGSYFKYTDRICRNIKINIKQGIYANMLDIMKVQITV